MKEQHEAPRQPRPDLSGYRILLVEDVELNRDVVCALLKGSGLEIDIARDGFGALEMLAGRECPYDLVLMDTHMPGMDGCETARRIRALPHRWAAQLPIIAMVVGGAEDDIARCMEAGMDDYIDKPIDFNVLIDKLRRRFAGRKPAAQQSSLELCLPWVDVESGLQRFGGKKQLYRQLLISFVENIDVESLGAALRRVDNTQGMDVMCALGEVAASLSFTELHTVADMFEQSLREQKDDPGIAVRFYECMTQTLAAVNLAIRYLEEE